MFALVVNTAQKESEVRSYFLRTALTVWNKYSPMTRWYHVRWLTEF